MLRMTDKEQILNNAGYKYIFDHEIYFNKKTKKIFSLEAIEDHDEKWLDQCIHEETNSWKFYFNSDPGDNVKDEIIRRLKS